MAMPVVLCKDRRRSSPCNPYVQRRQLCDVMLLYLYISMIIVSALRPPSTNKGRTNLIFGSRGASGIAEQLQNDKKKEIGIGFSFGDANSDEFIFFAVSGSRDLDNRIPW